MQAIDALAEVFVVALLPDRKLRAFAEQPLSDSMAAGKPARRHLLYCHFEDCIKMRWVSAPCPYSGYSIARHCGVHQFSCGAGMGNLLPQRTKFVS